MKVHQIQKINQPATETDKHSEICFPIISRSTLADDRVLSE
jgi:hypothetical protein